MIEAHYPAPWSRQIWKQMVYHSPSSGEAFDRWSRIRSGLVRCRMGVPDVSMVSKAVELESLSNGLTRHPLGVLGSSCGPHHAFTDDDVGGRHSIAMDLLSSARGGALLLYG